MPVDPKVTAYIADQAEPRRERLESLHTLILGLYPDAIADMHDKMPTYRAGDGWVATANRKQYFSLYTCAATHLESFRTKYPDIPTGKGCINFRNKDPFDMEAIETVIRHAIEHPKTT